jgi:hypothetical protein
MHTFNMLLEVIKAWPYLLFVSAVFGCTLIRFRLQPYSMNTLLVPIEIIGGSKAFCSPLTIRHVTLERFLVLKHVLPVAESQRL